MNSSTFTVAKPAALLKATGVNGQSIALLGGLLFALLYFSQKPRKGKKPPGPRGLPLIGNLLQLADRKWLISTEWKFKYGPIVGLNLAGKNTIVLNTHKVVSDLLDKRASIYSDRPRFIVPQEMLCGGLLFPFAPYGDTWRRMRRAAHEGLYPNAAENYHTLQETEATVLVDGILKTPDSWDDHLKRTAASQIRAMVYDTLPIKNHEEPLITRVDEFAQRIVKASYPGEHLVEFFPFLNSLPRILTPWKSWAEEWHRKDSELFMDDYCNVRDRVLAGDERPSLVSSLVKRAKESNFSELEKAWVAGAIVAAGTETTSAVMAWFILAITLYPEVQRRAQDEIDGVVGRDRMPNLDDIESLPYIRAIVREVQRWRPVTPLGVLHQSMEDDVYEDYFIPKGTLVICNVWAMNREPGLYGEDYDTFRPDRFLDEDGQLKPTDPTTKGEGHVTYGFGRRICVGRYVANNTLFIDIAHVLWACKIEKAKNFDGTDVKYNDHANFEQGFLVRPAPFRNVIKPRFPQAPKLVAEQKERLIAAASVR